MTIIFIYFSDLKGYVTGLTDEKLSRSNNLYFDVTVQDSPCQAKKVRVMADEEHSHSFFSKCMDERSPVKFTALSPSKSGQTFFNKKVHKKYITSNACILGNIYGTEKLKILLKSPAYALSY